MILYIVLYYIDTYVLYNIILFRYRAPGVRKRQQSLLLHAAVHGGLQGVNADWLLCYVPQGVNADWLLCYVHQGMNADWHCGSCHLKVTSCFQISRKHAQRPSL